MGIGYVVGCLTSIVLWKLDRQYLFYRINKIFHKKINNKILLQLIYVIIVSIICFFIFKIKYGEINNFITAFLVIDISNTEKKNLRQREKFKFYDSISIISRAVVCGFIAPLLFIAAFGNIYGIAYMFIYNISMLEDELMLFRYLFVILTIIPAVIAEIFMYIVYLCRNKKSAIDFKGDYFTNIFVRPLLNVDILGAYIESVNFYYLYSSKNTDYLKSYGEYTKKIDDICVKDYLSIAYGICLIFFIIFYVIIK
ncbi:hypothetical protein M2651_08135 [Clostridium sp. SYSU_GA19001]|uniref:hypothetical protein n=1 Tax=Clostridium caldaquaticum TaxID=2940653 RepID=UPI0020770446|nr:hypothetical protein [Clostridium caldaquaticum]MCM8710993.1 hypothetical protein [Clostridium caldaquaticum]